MHNRQKLMPIMLKDSYKLIWKRQIEKVTKAVDKTFIKGNVVSNDQPH